ncbi:hypothetical protein RN001_010717 [Aquatica leii]|uniref:Peptidase S1 domain-containing protein n=1 Tax=Aquatica leii TaxID=1421715 RepID=A0AAN7PAB1_9COLE|nr:hypothetical protein RN001_010717 [Aquatica leii]
MTMSPILLSILYVLVPIFGNCKILKRVKRIVGGENANINERLYLLSLENVNGHFCGACIITNRTVVTAAHCTPSELTVRAGSNFASIGGEVVEVASIQRHPMYNSSSKDYDVSLLYLVAPLTVGVNIDLPSINEVVPIGASVEVAGWGKTKHEGLSPFHLQRVAITRISDEQCNSTYKGRITSSMFCFSSNKKDSCKGDSGSPLVYNNKLVGIVSWGKKCGCALSEICCNTKASKPDRRIVGGVDADINDHLYLLSLQDQKGHFCGACILTEKTVLTAAHCTVGKDASELKVRACSNHTNSGGEVVKVAIIKRHPNFNFDTANYDIAVLILVTSVINGVKLNLSPVNKIVPVGATAEVAGWGLTEENGNIAYHLQKIQTKRITNKRKFAGQLMVRACSNHTNDGGELIQVADIKIHPNFNVNTGEYDVSILILVTPIINGIRINLPATDQVVPIGDSAKVAGWGRTRQYGNAAYHLQKVQIKRITDETCNSSYNGKITSSMFCFSSNKKDSCQGDSGGPLLYKDQLAGIVSWGQGCGWSKYPALVKNSLTEDNVIIESEAANINDYLYIVSLQDENGHYCGGCVLTERKVLTAGHCIYKKNRDQLLIRAGSNNTDDGGELVQVAKIIPHPKFNEKTRNYDVSILVLATPIKNAVRINLPVQNQEVRVGAWADSAGWIDIKNKGTRFQKVKTKRITDAECDEKYSTEITSEMFCFFTDKKNVCQRDCGGPLFYETKLVVLVQKFCDIQVSRLDERIVGGEDANINDHLYLLSLENEKEHICGASILNERTVLTAAHCLKEYVNNPTNLKVRAGSNHTMIGGEVVIVESILVHPQNNFKKATYDVAILRLVASLTTVVKINLPPLNEEVPIGAEAEVAGWVLAQQFCDSRFPRLDGRIVGGQNASINDHLYLLSLESTIHLCGASILSERTVLTAAHCVIKYLNNPTNLKVRAGSNHTMIGGEVVIVESILVHPQNNFKKATYDVAILRLVASLTTVVKINLPPLNEEVPIGAEAEVAGWVLAQQFCDSRFPRLDGRIVGGENASISDHLYLLSLESGFHLCGASILSERTVLTAARCLLKYYLNNGTNLKVRAGSNHTMIGGEVVKVDSILVHPQFNIKKGIYDVAILRLVASLTTVVKINLLPLNEDVPIGAEAEVAGWVLAQQFCDSRFPRLDGRIVGGENASISDHLYLLSLESTIHLCGASILSERTVLTAAHCVIKYLNNPTNLKVRAGSNHTMIGGEVVIVESILVHPQNNFKKATYDVAILRLVASLTTVVKINLLPLNEDVPIGAEAEVAGWGKTIENGNLSFYLQKVQVERIDDSECNSTYEVLVQNCCHSKNEKLTKRIVGGENTDIKNHLYLLSLEDKYGHFCGASLLTNDTALTAAHCTDKRKANELTVRAGANYTNGDYGQLIKVLKIKQHPDFNPKSGNYDVSILKLVSAVKDGKKVNLSSADEIVPIGATAEVVSWIKTFHDNYETYLIQKLQIQQITINKCNTSYDGAITFTMFCFTSHKRDTCEGDMGAPLLYKNKQIGIVSSRLGCGRPKYPGVYVNVAEPSIHDFIIKNKNLQ